MSSIDGTLVVGKIVANQTEFADNAVPADSVVHRYVVGHSVVAGTAVLAVANLPIHHFIRAGKVRSVSVVPYTAPTGGDLAYTVDVKLGNQATPAATILTGVITISSADADRQVNSGTLTSSPTTVAAGDFLSITVALTGSTGTQGQGYRISIVVDEDAV